MSRRVYRVTCKTCPASTIFLTRDAAERFLRGIAVVLGHEAEITEEPDEATSPLGDPILPTSEFRP